MTKLCLFAISALIGFGAFIASGLSLNAQMKGSPIPFSADWAHYVDGDDLLDGGKYFATSKAVRLEGVAGGDPYIIIHDFERMASIVVYVSERLYMEVDIDSDRLRYEFGEFGSPCPSAARTSLVGREILNGREVEKWVCTYPNEMTETIWYDNRLQTPIRSDDEEGDYIELTNIKEGPHPLDLFVPPPGYTRIEAPSRR